MSPLMLAAQQDDVACARLLLHHGADVHARDCDGDNGALSLACVCALALSLHPRTTHAPPTLRPRSAHAALAAAAVLRGISRGSSRLTPF